MKCAHNIVISFPGTTWRGVAMLTEDEAQALIQRCLALESAGKLRKDAWYIHAPYSSYGAADIDSFLKEHE